MAVKGSTRSTSKSKILNPKVLTPFIVAVPPVLVNVPKAVTSEPVYLIFNPVTMVILSIPLASPSLV